MGCKDATSPRRHSPLQFFSPHANGPVHSLQKVSSGHGTVEWQAESAVPNSASPSTGAASGAAAGAALDSPDYAIVGVAAECRSSGGDTPHAAPSSSAHNNILESFMSVPFWDRRPLQQARRQIEVTETRSTSPIPRAVPA